MKKTMIDEDLEEVKYYRKRPKYQRPPFQMICVGYYSTKHKRKTMDGVEYLQNLNPKSKESKAFTHIRAQRDSKTNLAIVNLMPSEKKAFFYEGIKEMVEKDIVRKVSNGLYMVNPFFLVPQESTEELIERWDQLKRLDKQNHI